MSKFEKPLQAGKDLIEINRNTMKEIVAIQVGGVRRYVETNQQFFRKVPSFRSLRAVIDAQRDYSMTLVSGAREDLQAGSEVVREAFQDAREVVVSVATKPAARKPAARKPATRKTAAAKKPAVKKTAAKKPAARKTAAKKAA